MANGIITLSKTGSGYMAGRIVWESSSNGTSENTSTVTATISVRKTGKDSTWGTWNGTLTVGAQTEPIRKYIKIDTDWVDIATVTSTVAHNANGSGTCYIYGVINGPTETTCEGTRVSGSETVDLDPIPRYATITSAPDFNDEDNPRITYSNPAGTSVDKLEACISLDGSKADISYRPISKTGNNYTFSLTNAERTILRQATTGSNSRTVKFYVRTTIGSNKKGSNLKRTFTIKNPNPTVDPIFEDQNSITYKLTGNRNILVKYYSNAKVTFNASAKKEATIASKKVVCGSKSRTSDGNINSIETDKFVFTVKDSRGNTTTQTVNKDSGKFSFVDYVKLTCNFSNNKPDADGNMTVRVTGNCYSGSFGSKSNSLTVKYRYRVIGGSYPSEYTPMTLSQNGNRYTATGDLTGLDYQKTYEFEVVAQDSLSNVTLSNVRVKSAPVFDWGENDFKFNVPVYDEIGSLIGNGLAKYSGSGDAAIDPDTTTEHLILTNKNTPAKVFYYVFTMFYSAKTTSNNRAQLAIPYTASAPIYHRRCVDETWSAWESDIIDRTHDHKYNASVGRFRFTGNNFVVHSTVDDAASNTNKLATMTMTDSSFKWTFNASTSETSDTDVSALLKDRYRPVGNDKLYLGDSSNKWKAVYAVNGSIQTSDRNQKKNITELDQKYIDLFDKLIPVSFEFIDNESDRVHIGFISQDVKAAMDEVGLSDIEFAGYCRDVLTKWNDETQMDEPVVDENGEPVYIYSLRYSEFIALNSKIIQNNRQRLSKQEQNINELREELNKMKELVSAILNKQ